MSFYLRKSIGLGPLRVSMSSRGLGASVGVPGLRLGAGPRGTYVSLGYGGIRYRTTVRPAGRGRSGGAPASRPGGAQVAFQPGDVVLSEVNCATTIEMAEAEPSEFVNQLNAAARAPLIWPWCLVLTVILMFVSPYFLLLCAPLTIWCYWTDKVRRTVVAFYEVSDSYDATSFQRLVDCCVRSQTVDAAWQVLASGRVATTYQHKVNAGASSLVNRVPLSRNLVGPPHISSNIAIPSISAGNRSVHFLPDRVLIREGRVYAGIPYAQLRTTSSIQRFIESGPIPSDSIVVGSTWQYVNVRGGPDRRFKNNRQLPILNYGRLTLTSGSGYHAIFDFSHPSASADLSESIGLMASARNRPAPSPPKESPRNEVTPAPAAPLKSPSAVPSPSTPPPASAATSPPDTRQAAAPSPISQTAARTDHADTAAQETRSPFARPAGTVTPATVRTRGADKRYEVRLSFVDAMRGKTIALDVSTTTPCSTCAGDGKRPSSSACVSCVAGQSTQTRRLNIRVPAGIDDGQSLRLKGQGDPGSGGGSAGDVYVLIRVDDDTQFGRSSRNPDDITVNVQMSRPDLDRGAHLTVPTLNGHLTIQVPAATISGKTFRVAGHGVQKPNGKNGDLLVTVVGVEPVVADLASSGSVGVVEGGHTTSVRPSSQTPGRTEPVPSPAGILDNFRLHSRPSTGPATASQAESARWISPGEQVTIAGFDINAGLFYLGASSSRAGAGVAVLDPALPIDSRPSGRPDDLPYWPSYATLDPASRAVYLEWLAGGRLHTDVPIGYVFLFFYGLEQRVLCDLLDSEPKRDETAKIADELRRLRDLYGENSSFNHYSRELLDVLDGLGPERELQPTFGPDEPWAPPLSLRRQLSSYAATGDPLPAEWALSWAFCHPTIYSRTPQRRCPDQYRQLFEMRYHQRHGSGLRVPKQKAPIRLSYHPANRHLSGLSLTLKDTFDVIEDLSCTEALRALAGSVNQELDAYSRYLGRHPDEAGSPTAIALLPADLPVAYTGAAGRLIEWATSALGSDTNVVVDGARLIALWEPAKAGVLTKAEAIACAQLLERHRIGLEPDVRLGGVKPSQGPCVLFRAQHETPRAAGPEYTAAKNLLGLAVTVALADGHVDPSEQQVLLDHLASGLTLTDAERERLVAHLHWLHARGHSSVALTGLTRQLGAMPYAQRRDVAEILVMVADADGVISPSEVKQLLRIYKLLDLDPDGVYSALHNQATTLSGCGIEEAAPRSVPPPTDGAGLTADRRIVLDQRRLAAAAASTAEVAALLSDVFADDDAPESTPVPEPVPVDVRRLVSDFDGLDADHGVMLTELLKKPQWTRTDFDILAARMGLMPSAALDTINDYAYERCQEPLFDVDDEFILNDYAAQELAR